MGLGNTQQKQKDASRRWVSIHHGKVELSLPDGQKQHFDYIEGFLRDIYTKVRHYGTEEVTKWFIDLTDEKGDLYTIGFPYNSGTLKSIVLSLASDEQLCCTTLIRIEAFQRKNYTNVVVWSDGVKLDWAIHELPPVEEVKVGGQVFKDESKRMEVITHMADEVRRRAQRIGVLQGQQQAKAS